MMGGEWLGDPQVWLSFLVLAVLEIVLGIDNLIFLSLAIDRLPPPQRRRARFAGLSLAMLTRIALLFSVVGLATLRRPLFTILGFQVSIRDAVLLGGGVFLALKSVRELKGMRARSRGGAAAGGARRARRGFWPVILEVALIDILFSIDSVFSAVGLASRVEVMVAAIVVSLPVMMGVSAVLARFIERHPSIKVLALGFLVAVGLYLMAQGAHWDIPRGYLYTAMGFAAAVEALNLRLGTRP
ncbi:MAG TPA: TerC family protein [Steroidobacteraceae bacterium]|nr:TerC family protein [Steroidobacteraceae bacterium]